MTIRINPIVTNTANVLTRRPMIRRTIPRPIRPPNIFTPPFVAWSRRDSNPKFLLAKQTCSHYYYVPIPAQLACGSSTVSCISTTYISLSDAPAPVKRKLLEHSYGIWVLPSVPFTPWRAIGKPINNPAVLQICHSASVVRAFHLFQRIGSLVAVKGMTCSSVCYSTTSLCGLSTQLADDFCASSKQFGPIGTSMNSPGPISTPRLPHASSRPLQKEHRV